MDDAPPHPNTPTPEDGAGLSSGVPGVALVDPGPRPYTLTDIVVGVALISAFEAGLGWAVAGALSSAAWGVVVGLGGFFVLVTLTGLWLRSSIGRWLGARRLAKTTIELAKLGDESIPAEDLCSSAMVLRACTKHDPSPLRRFDFDSIVQLRTRGLPGVWIVRPEGMRLGTGVYARPTADRAGRAVMQCKVVRESLGRQSQTVTTFRVCAIIALCAVLVVTLSRMCIHPVGCAASVMLAFLIFGLLPTQRLAMNDRLLACSREGLSLVLDDKARRQRAALIRRRAEQIGVKPEAIDAEDPLVRAMPPLEIRLPWRECLVVLYRPKSAGTDEELRPGSAWRWRIYPPRGYWAVMNVGGAYVIEADGIDPAWTPYHVVGDVLGS